VTDRNFFFFLCFTELSNDKRSNEKLELFQNIFDIDTADPYEDIKARKAQKEKEVSIRHIFSSNFSLLLLSLLNSLACFIGSFNI
jgi:hypothetical protein